MSSPWLYPHKGNKYTIRIMSHRWWCVYLYRHHRTKIHVAISFLALHAMPSSNTPKYEFLFDLRYVEISLIRGRGM